MSPSLLFAAGLTATVLAAFAVVGYLRGPLSRQLRELCGNAEGAEFWTVFSNVSLVLTSTIFAMMPEPGTNFPPLIAITAELKWGLMGLAGSVLMLGWVLSRFIPAMQPKPRPTNGGAL